MLPPPHPSSSVPSFFPQPVWNWSDNSSGSCEDTEMHPVVLSGPLRWRMSTLSGLRGCRGGPRMPRSDCWVFSCHAQHGLCSLQGILELLGSHAAWSVQPSRCPWTARIIFTSWNDLHEYKNCCSSVFRKRCVIVFRNSIFFLFFELNLAFSFGHLISSWSQHFLHPRPLCYTVVSQVMWWK